MVGTYGLTRYAESKALLYETLAVVTLFLTKSILIRHGAHEVIITDKGTVS